MKYLLFFLMAVATLPSLLFADTGSTEFPHLACAGQRIECKSWFEQPHACDQYLKNSAYTIVGGSAGASVQNYEFCASTKTGDDSQKSLPAIARNAALAVVIAGGAFFILWKIKKSRV